MYTIGHQGNHQPTFSSTACIFHQSAAAFKIHQSEYVLQQHQLTQSITNVISSQPTAATPEYFTNHQMSLKYTNQKMSFSSINLHNSSPTQSANQQPPFSSTSWIFHQSSATFNIHQSEDVIQQHQCKQLLTKAITSQTSAAPIYIIRRLHNSPISSHPSTATPEYSTNHQMSLKYTNQKTSSAA
jgi:hypothetical protein